jgi:ribonuclease BN (tRNA processing enzyme)
MFMAPFAADADLLIHESYSNEALDAMAADLPNPESRDRFRRLFPSNHSEISVVAKIAEEARVKRLALTHLLSVAGEIVLVGTGKEHYSGEVFAAQVGESLEI